MIKNLNTLKNHLLKFSNPLASPMASTLRAAVLITVGLSLFGCITSRTNPNMELMSESEYENTIRQFSDKKQVYDGMYQILEVTGTLHNTKVTTAQLHQYSRVFQWTQEQFNAEKSKQEQKMIKETEVFISFFVPDRKQDDLAKTQTRWKIFLDANGKRYEGKAAKFKA